MSLPDFPEGFFYCPACQSFCFYSDNSADSLFVIDLAGRFYKYWFSSAPLLFSFRHSTAQKSVRLQRALQIEINPKINISNQYHNYFSLFQPLTPFPFYPFLYFHRKKHRARHSYCQGKLINRQRLGLKNHIEKRGINNH